MRDGNVLVAPNVMLAQPRASDEIAYLPGDFAVLVYGRSRSDALIVWTSPDVIRRALTDRQRVEYEQYMMCLICHRPCAGTGHPGTTRKDYPEP